MIQLSIILPTYNEKENIPLIIDKIEKVLKKNSFEIIIVDDNSPDDSWKIAKKISQEKNHVHAIRRLHERGLSSAAMEGFSLAKGKYLVLMDADMQHDEKVIPQFIEQFEQGAELVVGSRKSKGGGIEDWPLYRRFASQVATIMANLLLSKTTADPMSGFFGLEKKFYDETAPNVNPMGFKILLEFLNQAKGRNISEVGYLFRAREFGQSKLLGSVILDYLVGLYELRLGKIVPTRFVKYALVGLSGVIVNQLGLLTGKTLLSWNNGQSLILGIELSILSNFVLHNNWTFKDKKLSGITQVIKGLIFFQIISLAGAVINYAVAIFLNNQLDLNIYLANFAGIATATLWNFSLNLNVTWRGENYS